MKRRNFLKTLGIGLAYACAPIIFIKEKATGWMGIHDGSFLITIDGNPVNVGPLDFTGIGGLNSISDIISKEAEKHDIFCSMDKHGYLKFNKIKGE